MTTYRDIIEKRMLKDRIKETKRLIKRAKGEIVMINVYGIKAFEHRTNQGWRLEAAVGGQTGAVIHYTMSKPVAALVNDLEVLDA